ncbi:uncharacterized protein LOC135387416 [Ornithodoros turicata]|uniref:uncharacterized protein LOC135387416 n=1 Tax=Ornithodoros turicata TaxID=34597 RepID=UPI0031394147
MPPFLQRFLTLRSARDIENKQVVSDEQKLQWPVSMAEMLPLLIVLSCFGVAFYFVLAPRRAVPFEPPVTTMIRPEGQVTGQNELSGGGLLVGHAGKKAGMRPSTSLPHDEDVASTSDTEPVVITPHGNGTMLHNKDQRCIVKAHFTLCSNVNQIDKFFFRADKHSCVSVMAVPPPPCLVGSNRFRSMHDCKKACNDQPVPQEKCSFPAEFHTCTPSDISRKWYFVRNGTCVAWHFRGGNCVSPQLALFRSEEDCRTRCLGGRVSERHPGCSDSPVEHVCSPLHMLFPVYSVSGSHHKISCVTVDTAEPRCLSGSNRFRSKRECEQACLQ